MPESSIIPVSNYTIPQTMSEHDSISRTIKRKGMQDIRREILAYTGGPPKPTEIPTQETPKKLWNQTLTHWNMTVTQILKKIPHIKKV